jgi:hypothetical protein
LFGYVVGEATIAIGHAAIGDSLTKLLTT